MDKNTKILIVSYQLPPYGGIGGRRWAKFGKYLINKGYDVHFLTAEPKHASKTRWEEDYNTIKDHISYFKSNYPDLLKGGVNGIVQKIRYRIALWKIRKKEKGNYFDHSCLDEKTIVKCIENKIADGYATVISTGAPFTQLYYIAKLKKKRNDFHFIADLRDPWTLQNWSYGFQHIEPKRRKIEEDRELFMLKHADKVITVLPRMSSDFSEMIEDNQKISTIYNGFDPVEFGSKNILNNSKKIKLVFAGNYYDSALHHIQSLVNCLGELKNNDPEIYDLFQFDFYGSAPSAFFSIVKEEENIRHHGFVPSNEVSGILAAADLGMLFLIDGFNYSLSTKFFEYIAQNKSILLFAKKGDTSAFIEENKIGWHFKADVAIELFKDIVMAKKSGRIGLNTHFKRDNFSLPHLTDKVEEILSSI